MEVARRQVAPHHLAKPQLSVPKKFSDKILTYTPTTQLQIADVRLSPGHLRKYRF